MDEALKARLIGAAVLVTIAVLLIPELLSGRKAVEPVAEEGDGARGTRTFTIELDQAGNPPSPAAPGPTAAPVVPKAAQVAPDSDGSQEPDRPATAEPRKSEPPPAAAVQPAPKPRDSTPASSVAAKSPSATPTAPTGGWSVQVGAFSSVDTARGLVRDLAGAGYEAYVLPLARGGKTLHRVRVGPVPDKGSAEQLAQRLKGRGLPATVVQND